MNAISRYFRRGAILGVWFCTFGAGPALAQDLVAGLAASPTTTDPQFQNHGPSNGFATHLYDRLVHQDERQRLIPGLATEWRAVDNTTWEFKLRRGVRFHDGSAFDANDVVATLKRIPLVPNSPSSFAVFIKAITETIVVDPYTIRFKTATPYPLLPYDLVAVSIISRKAEKATTAEFNSGAAQNGTGPFKFVSFAPGDRLVLTRNDNYWGDKPHWKQVTFRVITNNAARVAALLAGDVQLIENVPTTDITRIEENSAFRVERQVSNLLMYLHMDTFRDQTPFATDAQGAVLPRNPLKDLRVRRALSMAIDRNAIVERIMLKQAIAAGGLVPESFFGYNPNLRVDAYKPDDAKKLLAEAGYPNGFNLTIHGPNDRFLNDSRVMQTAASMFSKIGVQTKVEAMPLTAFLPPASHPNYAYSMILLGWNTNTGEASSVLRGVLATVDRDKGMGPSNRGRYSNAKLDSTLAEALATVDNAKREALLRDAAEIGIRDVGILPLYYEVSAWAMRRNITYAARSDQFTMAGGVRPAP